MKGMMIRIPPSWYHTVFALDEFNVCEAMNCGPLTAESLQNALNIINIESSHNIDKICQCEDLLNQQGDLIAIDLNKNQYIQKITRQIQQLTTSEIIKTKIHSKNNCLLSSVSGNIQNQLISSVDIDETKEELKESVQIDSFHAVEKIECLFNKLKQDLVDNRNHIQSNTEEQISFSQIQQNDLHDNRNHNHGQLNSNINDQTSFNQIQQNVINDNSNQRKHKHNDQIQDRTITYIDRKSGEEFNCAGWIFKGRNGRIRKRKNVICHFCEGENEKTFDDNNLRAHLESVHCDVESLNAKSLVFILKYIYTFYIICMYNL